MSHSGDLDYLSKIHWHNMVQKQLRHKKNIFMWWTGISVSQKKTESQPAEEAYTFCPDIHSSVSFRICWHCSISCHMHGKHARLKHARIFLWGFCRIGRIKKREHHNTWVLLSFVKLPVVQHWHFGWVANIWMYMATKQFVWVKEKAHLFSCQSLPPSRWWKIETRGSVRMLGGLEFKMRGCDKGVRLSQQLHLHLSFSDSIMQSVLAAGRKGVQAPTDSDGSPEFFTSWLKAALSRKGTGDCVVSDRSWRILWSSR